MPNTRSTNSKASANDRSDESDESKEHDITVQGEAVSMRSKLEELTNQLSFLKAEFAKMNLTSNVTNGSSDTNSGAMGNGNDSGALAVALSDLSRTLSNNNPEQGRKLYELPEFDGRPEDWPMFSESFHITTDEYNYSNQQNLMRLQKALKGKAKEVVECLLIHSSNVGRIIDTLCTQFGRPELLVKSQIAKLQSIPSIPENCLAQILPFAIKVQNLSLFLKAAKCEHHLSNPTLMDELLLKLPVERRLEWARYINNISAIPTVEDFSEWLQVLASEVRVACTDLGEPTTQIVAKRDKPTRFFLANQVHNSENIHCGACSGRHDITKCKRFLEMGYGQRWRLARQGKLCFNCLQVGHQTNTCTKANQCDLANCTRKIHKLLHGNENMVQVQQVSSEPTQSFTGTALHFQNKRLLFKILPVKLYANGKVVETFAFIDEGSSISLINKNLSDRLGLRGPHETLTMQWFANNSITESATRVSMQISGVRPGSKIFELKNVRTVTDLRLPIQTVEIGELRTRYHLPKNLPIDEYTAATPELLIGLDNIHLGVSRKIIVDGWKGPAVVSTRLGWVVYGSVGRDENHSNIRVPMYFAETCYQDDLDELVRSYIANDNLAVKPVDIVESIDMSKAKETLERTTKRVGTRFETGLLWRSDNISLPPSKQMAGRRFFTLERKFQQNEEFHCAYSRLIEEYERKGYCRRLSSAEVQKGGERIWFLPHFGVVNPNKPGKLRIVFDAAAEINGISLNSMLLSGPDGCQPLTEVLMKFRQRRVGICADIVEMFHQVKIREEDQMAQRFLWRSHKNEFMREYVMTSMTFGATCSPCSAQFVKNKNADEFRAKFPAAVDAIINNHYVEDFVHCFSSESEAKAVSKEIVWIQKQAGFDLKRFVSNSEDVVQELGERDTKTSVLSLDKEDAEHCGKVLGLYWDTNADVLKFVLSFGKIDANLLEGGKRPTKREMLAISMSVFDPFGLAAEYSLISKLALQSVWRQRVDWDEKIPDGANAMWLVWIQCLKEIQEIRVPRCYSYGFTYKPVELHIFADVSEQAYAAVAYWRIIEEPGRVRLAFVAGKTKCAPLRATSIPRLELQSAVLATRLRQMVLQNHDVTPRRVVMWSDATTVLAWIRSDHRRYKPYVAHRVSEILGESEIEEWRWLPSALNPADFGTRLRNEKRESFWLSGPEFLKDEEMKWPERTHHSETKEELRNRATFLFVNTNNFYERFSCFQRMKRVAGWIKRYRENCRTDPDLRQNGSLKVYELRKADLAICRGVQMTVYADEYEQLLAGKPVDRSSTIRKLNPFLDSDGVIRVDGRINSAFAVPVSVRNPIIMPQNHYVTELIVNFYHKVWKHQNEATIINEIRRRYWIPHIRTVVRQTSKKCPDCKRKRAEPQTPLMGQLPEDRLTPFVRPFSYVGLDYMGPFFIVTGRRTEKRWIALFTCLTIRAVHLEIVKDLTTDACLMSIRNFISRRGTPVRIRSDNATTFVGADRELKQQLDQWNHGLISDTLASSNIEWIFNCPLNPHAGGCWERLVRSVKRAMGWALYRENLQEHSLFSLMCEAENIVNSRPLTYIPLDTPNDEPLTPNHFLLGIPNSQQTPHPHGEDFKATRKQWRKVQQAQHRFWNKRLSEYLPNLCRRTKWYQPVKPLALDDVVLICDSSVHRSKWPLGRIIRVFPGKDSQVRVAEVMTKTGVLRRPACMLARLDVSESRSG